MPEHHSPVMHSQETSTRQPIEGVATSTVGFLGTAERRPATPSLLSSVTEYHEIFGDDVFDGTLTRYLPSAIEGYFLNGGRRCYVQRVVGEEASAAGTIIDATVKVVALGPGHWGNRVSVEVASAGHRERFRLTVKYWSSGIAQAGDPTVHEEYDDLSIEAHSPDYYITRINGVSRLVTVETIAVGGRPADVSAVALGGGSDGQANADIDFKNALDLLGTVMRSPFSVVRKNMPFLPLPVVFWINANV